MSEVRLIDANTLKAKIKSKYDNGDDEFDKGYNIGLGAAVDLIDSAPTVTPDMAQVLAYESGKASADRPTGKWIENELGYYCSRCGMYGWNDYSFCQKCGARMEEVENDGRM